MPQFIIKITDKKDELIQDDDVCSYLVSSLLDKEFIIQTAKKAATADKLVLIEGPQAPELCVELKLDGVVANVSGSEKIAAELKQIRKIIGAKKALGVVCRNRRHEIMVASETEPEFMILNVWNEGKENVKELISWYNEFFLIQLGLIYNDEELKIDEFEADFIILNAKEYKILVAKNKSLD